MRCLEIRGIAEQAVPADVPREPNGEPLDAAIIRVYPRRVISFGIDDQVTEPHQLVAHVRNVAVAQPAPQQLLPR